MIEAGSLVTSKRADGQNAVTADDLYGQEAKVLARPAPDDVIMASSREAYGSSIRNKAGKPKSRRCFERFSCVNASMGREPDRDPRSMPASLARRGTKCAQKAFP